MKKILNRHNSLRLLPFAMLLVLSACTGTAGTPVPPGQSSAAGYGSFCKAGIYSCRTPYPVPLGSPCSCPALGATSYGTVLDK